MATMPIDRHGNVRVVCLKAFSLDSSKKDMKPPSTVSLNTYRAYINRDSVRRARNGINSIDLDWDANLPETLRERSLRTIGDNWAARPVFAAIEFAEDLRHLLDTLAVDQPLPELCAHIDDDSFWRRAFVARWPTFYPSLGARRWIQLYLERHLAETLEDLKPADFDAETIQQLVELCSPHVRELRITRLQPGAESHPDHIPFDSILANLAELRRVDLTFDVKGIGTGFVLGCANISAKDIQTLAHGLALCNEIEEFRLHSTKLEPDMLKLIAGALDKQPHLRSFELSHCRCGDVGLLAFVDALSNESFPSLREVVLTNNFLSQDGVVELISVLRNRPLERIDLRLNPITSEGAAAVFGICNRIPVRELSLACCSLDEQIGPLLLKLLRENRTIKRLNVSANRLGQSLGEAILANISVNGVIQELDIRNSDISYETKSRIDSIILENRDKFVFNWD